MKIKILLLFIKTFHTVWFLSVCRMDCRNAKLRRACRLKMCALCERLRDELADAVRTNYHTAEIKKLKRNHNDFMKGERPEYTLRRERGCLPQNEYL